MLSFIIIAFSIVEKVNRVKRQYLTLGGYYIVMFYGEWQQSGLLQNISRKALCNQDHYSSLGRNTFILLLKCVSCVYHLVAREEFHLPIRDRDIGHDFELALVPNDGTIYIDWCKELDVWVELTERTEEKKALAIFSSFRSKAKKVVLQLKMKDLKVSKEVVKLKESQTRHLTKISTRQFLIFMKNLKD